MVVAAAPVLAGLRRVEPAEAEARIVEAALALAPDPNARRQHARFPGPSPVSIERRQFQAFAQPYWACEKTDGTRAALFLGEVQPWGRVCALLDRGLRAFWAPVGAAPTAAFQGTLLDGEVCADPDDPTPAFRAFDALAAAGIPVRGLDFSRRLEALHAALAPYRRLPGDAISVRAKKFFGPGDVGLLREHLASLRVPHDGLVFTPEAGGVELGRHTRMFKFKPAGHHTVDFLVDEDGGARVWDASRKTHARVASLEAPTPPPGAIAECALTCAAPETWRAVKVRTDKTHANDLITYEGTRRNILEDLDAEDVLRAFGRPA